MKNPIVRPSTPPTSWHAPSCRRAVALALALLTLVSLVVPARVEAASAIPVLDVLTLSAYIAEKISSNDHVAPMTTAEPRPSCYAGGSNSAWYKVTTSVKGQVGVGLVNYTGAHSIALYQGTSFADVVELSCMTYPPTSSLLQPYMRAGDSVYVQVIADGPYLLSGIIGPTRFIDGVGDAEDLSLGFLNFGNWTTEYSTVDAGEPLPCGGTRTSWLKYVPDQSGIVTFTVMGSLNDVLALYRSASAGPELIGCGAINTFQTWELTSLVETRVTADLMKGVTYYLQIGATQGPGGAFIPLVSRGLPPTNDSPSAAIALSQNHTVNATTVGAFTRWLAPNCGTWETAWYLVTPQSSGTLEVTAESKPTGDPNFAPALAIHRADSGELLACGADTSATVTQRTPAIAGTSYLIAVMSAGHPGDFRMHWEVK